MPYLTQQYTPPAIPPVLTQPTKTFTELRDKLTAVVSYLQQLNSTDVDYFQHLQANVNQATSTEGPDIPAAQTITVTNFMHVITGTAQIANINVPKGYAGQVMLIARDGFQLVSGGNIRLIFSPNQLSAGSHVVLTFIPSKGLWFTDSCRLTGTGGTFGAPSGGVFVTPSLAGTGIAINATTFSISNTGVLSNVAGTGIGVNHATGNVTITNNGVTSVAGTTNQIHVSTPTGATTLSLAETLTSHTPTLSGSTTAGSVTYTVRQGYVYALGSLTTVTFNVQWSAFSGAVGNVQISLPSTIANLTNGFWGGTLFNHSGVTYTAGYTYLTLEGALGNSGVNITQNGSGQTTIFLPVGALGSSGILAGTIAYRTA